MGILLPFRQAETVMDAWTAYERLALALRDDPSLFADMGHCQRMARAHAHWQQMYLASEDAA